MTSTRASFALSRLFSRDEQLSAGRVILLICLLSGLAYANSLGGDFVFDDDEVVVDNRDIRSWSNLERAFTTHVWAFRERPDALRVPVPPPYYRPVFTVFITAEYKLFGLWPQGWHLVSLLLHIACSIEVYFLLLLMSRSQYVALVAASLFAVYPVHVESVSWISGMTDPLYGISFLASFYFYLRFRDSKRTFFFVLSLALFALSAFSKETALSLIVLILVYDLIESTATRHKVPRAQRPAFARALIGAARSAVPYCVVAAVYLVSRYLALGGLTWDIPNTHKGPVTDTLLTLPSVIWSYLLHLVWPVGLSIAYQTQFVESASSPRFLIPAVGLVAIGALLFTYRKRAPTELWHALSLVFVPLLPVFDLRHLSEEYLVFDRYLYISVAGWCCLIALGLAKASERLAVSKKSRTPVREPAVLIVVLMVAGLAAGTARENLSWSDSYALWSNAARVRPNFWAAHYNAALALMKLRRFEQARDVLLRAAKLAPDEPSVFDALGRTYDEMGDTARALENFKQAISIDREFFESLNNAGTAYFKSGDVDAAERYFAAALRVKPQATAARFNLALCYSKQGRHVESINELERLLEMMPSDAEAHYQLGLAYEATGRTSDASRTLRHALELSKSRPLSDKITESLTRLATKK